MQMKNMKKLLLFVAFLFVGGMVAQAQISTGESTASVFKTGNRAEKGDLGIYLGATTSMLGDLINSEASFTALPLINLKYMNTDKVETRLGIEWWKRSETIDESNEYATNFMLYPGLAYHFSKSNILDVYVGGELPIGWGYAGQDGDGFEYGYGDFRIGLGAFIGLQAYVCNLPLAVGLEYGLSTLYHTVGDGRFTEDGMTIEYADVDSKRWTLGNQARVTITYFFKM